MLHWTYLILYKFKIEISILNKMEFKVSILNKTYEDIVLHNDNETLKLSLQNFKNFQQKPFFHNDTIKYDKENNIVIDVKHSILKKRIVGVLKISTTVIYGLNNKRNPYFLFEPLDNYYPNFLVSVNDRNLFKTNSQQYAIIRFDRWIQKMPHGELIKIIGKVGEENVEYEKILNYYNVNQRTKKLHNKYKIKGNSKLLDIVSIDELTQNNYIDIRSLNIISIDPEGCLDIDDALSYEFINNKHKVGIHIADVSFWMDKLDLYNYIEKQFFTVYTKDKKFDVFPKILSDYLFSLRCKQDRLTLSLYVYFDDNYNMIDFEIQKSIVNLNKNFTYEKANKMIKQKKGNIFKLFKISKTLFQSKNNDVFDSHHMVENFMILANKLTAEFLIKNNKNPVLRTHKETKINIEQEITDEKTRNFIHYYNSQSAIYEEFNGSEKSYYHHGLKLDYYTHFTSPIRRVVDIITHLQIKEVMTNQKLTTKLKYNCDDINKECKINKKISREIDLVYCINHSIKNKTYECYVIDFKENNLKLYFPELNLLYSKNIFDKKLLNIINFEKTTNQLTIINKNTNKKVNINLYQKLSVDTIINNTKLNLIINVLNNFL